MSGEPNFITVLFGSRALLEEVGCWGVSSISDVCPALEDSASPLSPSRQGEQPSLHLSQCLSTIMFCCTTGPKAVEPNR